MTTLIIFLIILGVLVLVHEFGHYIVAKYFGVKVEEFAFGFPPKLWSRKKGDTEYQINAIPFGGYVKLFGEDGSGADNSKSFAYKSWFARAAIILAGIIMNIIAGAIILSFAFMIGLPVMEQNYTAKYPNAAITPQVIIYQTSDKSPLKNQVQDGDEITKINNVPVTNIEQFRNQLQTLKDQNLTLTLKRKQETVNLTTQSFYSPEDNAWQLGVILIEGQIIKYPWYLAFPMGVVETFRLLFAMIVALFTIVKELLLVHRAPAEIAGPVGIYKIAGIAKDMGFVYLLQLTAALSINLAIINVLPLPALDGGRIFFIALEGIFKKKVSPNVENLIHTVGFFAIIGLIILVTISDVKKFF